MPMKSTREMFVHELADCYDNQGLPQLRDRFLVLAADAAQTAGQPEEAERLHHALESKADAEYRHLEFGGIAN